MQRIQQPQLQRAPHGLLVIEVKGNFARNCLHTRLGWVLAKETKVLVHYHMEMGRVDYVSEHESGVLSRCYSQACGRLTDQGVTPATEGVWANWARLHPTLCKRRTAQRIQRCRHGGEAAQRQTALVKALLMMQFFKKISWQMKNTTCGLMGGSGTAWKLPYSPSLILLITLVLAKAGIEPGSLWRGVSSLLGFVKGCKKGGKETH